MWFCCTKSQSHQTTKSLFHLLAKMWVHFQPNSLAVFVKELSQELNKSPCGDQILTLKFYFDFSKLVSSCPLQYKSFDERFKLINLLLSYAKKKFLSRADSIKCKSDSNQQCEFMLIFAFIRIRVSIGFAFYAQIKKYKFHFKVQQKPIPLFKRSS